MVRRTGDTVDVAGDYQHRALTQGPAVQRFWHWTKQLSIGRYLPPEPGRIVVDVGCGSGTISAYLGSFGANVLGIDGNPDAIAFADRAFARPNVRFLKGLVDETFGEPESIDAIYCLEVIEHVYLHQARTMLGDFHRLLRPGGRVFISTPNYRSAWPVIEWAMDTLQKAPRLRGEQHVEFYNSRKLRRLGERAGFNVDRLWSCCLLAPWLAPFSWRLAEHLHALEASVPLPVGAVLMCVLSKPALPAGSAP